MKRNLLLSGILSLAIGLSGFGQHADLRQVKTITDAEKGSQEVSYLNASGNDDNTPFQKNPEKDVNINWQTTDGAAIGSRVKVSQETGQTFMTWTLNDKRVSLYENSATPEWEKTIDTDWEWPIDMTEDGEWVAIGFDSVAQVSSNASSAVTWEALVVGSVIGLKLNPDGTKLFVAYNSGANAKVAGYTVGDSDPDWEIDFTGSGTAFSASGDGSILMFCQYTGVNKIWIIDAANGDILFDDFYKNQTPPAASYDGKIVLNGDYSGNVHVYEYDESLNTYIELWDYKVGGGGTSVWITGMGVSGDGSTLAVGTLVFLSGGGYEGEIYLFNAWSPVPLWIFSNTGDEVCGIDFTFDGSLMAAVGWGPLNHTKPDFWLFRKESSDPVFTINTLGSLNAVDLSPDGTLCAVTGKAVHNREFGNGGLLYNIDSHPDGGIIAGMIDLENTDDEKNAKVVVNELVNYFSYSDEGGSHEMKYVPEGTYSVTASKIGYYPVTLDNVEIMEGEITTLDFNLEETGNPPYGLNATQGAGLTVQLTWNCSNPQDYEGFNIYRKLIPEDLFPEEPIATVTNSTFSYEDENMMPLKDYYYAVTAIIGDGVESPYSNVAEGWISDGYVTGDISAYTGTAPVIDGTISPGEWDDAFMLDASDFLGRYDNIPNPIGSVTMYFKTNEDLSELYVACINTNDTQLEDHDEVALYIDDNNDGSYPEPGDISEGNYWAVYYAAGNEIRYRPIFSNGGVSDVILLEDPQIEVSDATGVIVYEFMIPVGNAEPWQIKPNPSYQSGLFSFTLDDPSAFDGYWPCWNPEIFVPLEYGTITFGAEDEVPPPPTGLELYFNTNEEIDIVLEWEPAEINDFDHYNVYLAELPGEWELLGSTIGRQFFYSTPLEYLEFYVTTVDHGGQESAPSEIAVYDLSVGIRDVHPQLRTSIYPNPSDGMVNITMQAITPGDYTLTLVNMQGSEVALLYSGTIAKGSKTIQWDCRDARGMKNAPGVYFVRFSGPSGSKTAKLVLLGD